MDFDSLEVLVELQDDTYLNQSMMKLVPNCSAHTQLLAKWRVEGAETLKVPVQGDGQRSPWNSD